jgi:hypothetical protein
MASYETIDTSPRILVVDFEKQLLLVFRTRRASRT